MFFRKNKVTEAGLPPSQVNEIVASTEAKDTGAPRKKILVVDDDPITVKTLAMTLNARGYNVLSAGSGAEAIGLVRDEKPDMMLVDVCLAPDMAVGGMNPWDGFQVTRWLKRANTKQIPAIIISGADKPEYKKRAEDAGATSFMAKPIDNTVLLASITSALANPPLANEFVCLKMAS